jgi:hypothetical protein
LDLKFSAQVMKNTTYWDITPCSSLKFSRCIRRTYLHIQGTISQGRNRHESRWYQLSLQCFEDGGDRFF